MELRIYAESAHLGFNAYWRIKFEYVMNICFKYIDINIYVRWWLCPNAVTMSSMQKKPTEDD